MSGGSQKFSGLDVLVERPHPLPGERVGLLTHAAAVTADLRRGVDALVDVGLRPHCLIGPEHGYWGTGQAGTGGSESVDPATGIPVLSSYGMSGPDLDRLLIDADVDAVVVDLQDVGCRFYTYLWSMFDVMAACARLRRPVLVLDRPAPVAASALGPGVAAGFASFVGRVSIPLRHGGRIGDLARHFAANHLPASLDLTVIAAPGADGEGTWVPTSPNMPTRTTVALYPALGLLEGTTWSEGRGTTRPFELFGVPWAGPEVAAQLRERSRDGLLPGVAVREAKYIPTHGPFAGARVHGAQLHLRTDPREAAAGGLDPLRIAHTVLSVLRGSAPERDLWRSNAENRPFFIDLLWGSAALREGIDDGASLEQILAASPSAPVIDGGRAVPAAPPFVRDEPADPALGDPAPPDLPTPAPGR